MKKLLFLLVVFYVNELHAQTQYLVPYRTGNLWGYADTNLHMVVSPVYDDADLYWRGFALVRKERYYGLLKPDGAEWVQPIYEEIKRFEGGYVVVTKDQKKGMIDLHTGQFIIPIRHRHIEPMDDSDFLITDLNDNVGIWSGISRRWLLPQAYKTVRSLWANNYILGTTLQSMGIYNAASKQWLLPPIYQEISLDWTSPILNLWRARGKEKSIWFKITEDGRLVVQKAHHPPKAVASTDTSYIDNKIVEIEADTLSMSAIANGQSLKVNQSPPSPTAFDAVIETPLSGSSNIYIVRKSGQYGLANRENHLLLKCEYDTIIPATNVPGYILKIGERQGAFLIDCYPGHINAVIEPKYDYILRMGAISASNYIPFSRPSLDLSDVILSLVYVSKDGKRGFVDLSGREYFKE